MARPLIGVDFLILCQHCDFKLFLDPRTTFLALKALVPSVLLEDGVVRFEDIVLKFNNETQSIIGIEMDYCMIGDSATAEGQLRLIVDNVPTPTTGYRFVIFQPRGPDGERGRCGFHIDQCITVAETKKTLQQYLPPAVFDANSQLFFCDQIMEDYRSLKTYLPKENGNIVTFSSIQTLT